MAVFSGALVGVIVIGTVPLIISITHDMVKERNRTKGLCEKLRESAVVDTDGIWHFNDALSEFKGEIADLDSEIKYAEEVKRLEKEKAEKEAYLEALYLPDEAKDVVYLVRESSFHGGLYIGIYATRTEAEGAKSEIEGRSVGRNVRIEEHTLNRPKKEGE